MTDLAVVGGGPVGLAAAIDAVSRGLAVTVVEPRTGPVDKACGEGLMPGAVAALAALGVHPRGVPFDGIAYLSANGAPSTAVRHTFSAGPGLGVRRTTLHDALAHRAAEVGVRVRTARVTGLAQDDDGVHLDLDDGDALEADWVLGADGLHSVVRRLTGTPTRTDGRRFGLRRHAAVAPWSRDVEVHWAAGAEAYVTPVDERTVGVAVLTAPGTPFPRTLDAFPALGERLAGAAWVSPVRGAGPLRQVVSRKVTGRVLLVGDAAGYVDALTGEGMRVGLATAAAALDAVVAGTPERYERHWVEVTRRYRWLTSALVGGTRHPVPRRLLLPTCRALPGAFGRACEALAA